MASTANVDEDFKTLPPRIARMRQQEFQKNWDNRFGVIQPLEAPKPTLSLSEEYNWEARKKRLENKYSPRKA